MTFDELLDTYQEEQRQREAAATPPTPPTPSPPPKPHRFWRVTRPFVMLFDVVGLLFATGSFFTWNDVREQAASSLPRKLDYAVFAFLVAYGFLRAVFDGRVRRRWYPISILNCAFGASLLWFYMGVGPPGLLIRLSAAFDESEGTREGFVVLESRERSGVSRINTSPEKGYYTIAREGRLKERWEVYLGWFGRSP